MKTALILIVEDEAPQAEMIRYNLEKAGFRTVVANTGGQALELAEDEKPDLVLLDWMLPTMSGVDFTRQLKKDKLLCQIPIIMLTAKAEEENKVKGLEAGVDDYVIKPFSPKELIARIRAVLRKRPGKARGTLY